MRLIPRMTTRRWMVAVAAVAPLCLEHRRRSFESLAAYHESRRVVAWSILPPRDIHRYAGEVLEWHAALARKYRHAARYPWLPVEPDPSPPDAWLPIEPDPPPPEP